MPKTLSLGGLYNQIDHQEIKGSTNKKLDAIQWVFNNSLKKEPEYQWINKYSSRIYQQEFRHLKTAFTRFHTGVSGYPKFKRKRNNSSFTVINSNGKSWLTQGKKIVSVQGGTKIW